MKISGGCHCGSISYEAEVDPESVSVCHCTDCQTLSGSAFRTTVPAKKEAFRMTGTPRLYVKTAESGNKRAQSFCGTCGTPIYSTDPVDSQVFFIRLGTVKQRAELPPKVQIWSRSSLGWTAALGAVKRVEKQ